MSRAKLTAVVNRGDHDLPPLWDGKPIKWGEWELVETSARYHGIEPCEVCGCTDAPLTNHGLTQPEPGELYETTRTKKLPSGRSYDVPATRPAYPVIRFLVERCPRCELDTVFEQPMNGSKPMVWVLDSSDYGTAGSSAPEETP